MYIRYSFCRGCCFLKCLINRYINILADICKFMIDLLIGKSNYL